MPLGAQSNQASQGEASGLPREASIADVAMIIPVPKLMLTHIPRAVWEFLPAELLAELVQLLCSYFNSCSARLPLANATHRQLPEYDDSKQIYKKDY